MRKSQTNTSGDINVTEEGREKVVQALEQKLPCSPLERTVVGQAALLQPMELCSGAEICVQSMEERPHAEAGGHVRRKVQHVEEPRRSRFSGRSCSSEFMLE